MSALVHEIWRRSGVVSVAAGTTPLGRLMMAFPALQSAMALSDALERLEASGINGKDPHRQNDMHRISTDALDGALSDLAMFGVPTTLEELRRTRPILEVYLPASMKESV